MIEKLQPWAFGHNPAFDDKESLTAIQQTAKIYEKVNELIESYNGFGEDLRKDFEKFKTDSNTNYSEFISLVENKFNSFKNTIDLKISEQDTKINNSLSEYERKVNETLLYFKTNLPNSIKNEIEKMKNSGELDTAIYEALDNIHIALENYKSELNTKFADYKTSINAKIVEITENNKKWQNDTKADLQETERAFESRVDNNLNVVNARMDTFTAGNNAGTENNSELLDIRIGFDGQTYTTAGTAVRQQIKWLNNIEFDKYLIAFDTRGQIMFAIPDPVMLDLDQMITYFKRYNNWRDDLIIPHFNENCRALLIPKTVKTVNTSTIFLNFQHLKYIIFEGDPTSYSNDDWRIELAQLNPSTSKIFMYDQDFKTSRFANVLQMFIELDNELTQHNKANENGFKKLNINKAEPKHLDEYKKEGNYFFTINPTAEPQVTGLPVTSIGLWKMSIWKNDEFTYQQLFTPTGHTYYRIFDGDSWTPFVDDSLANITDIQNLEKTKISIVEYDYGQDLADCTDKSKIYYFRTGIVGLRGSNTDFGGAGMYIGFIKKINNGWLFISSGEGNKKSNYIISENGEINLIGSTYDYNDLRNKPTINNVELTGNKTLSELGLYSKGEVDEKLLNKISTVNGIAPNDNGNVDVDMSFLSNIQPLVVNSDTKIPIDISTEACLVDGKIGRKIIVECKNATGLRVYGKDYTIAGTNEIYFQNQTSAFTLFFDTTNKKFIASATATDKNYTYPRYCKFAIIRSNWISDENTVTSVYSVSCNFNYTINGGHLWNENQIVNLVENYKTYNYFTDKTFATEKLGYNISKMYSLPTKPDGTTSPQGMAINNGVIFQMYNDDKVTLIDYSTGQKITTLDITSGHGDTAEFSNEKYSDDDEFNLLYTTTDTYPSQVRVHRITRTGTESIRTLTFPTDKTKYFAGHCTDFEKGILYQVGYATNSYYNAENNYMVVSKWDLNTLTENSDGTLTPSYLGSFNIPFMITVQDQMFYDGKLFLISSHWENTQSIIYVVDIQKESIVNKINELPTDIKTSELEGIDKVFNGNKLNIILSLNKGVYKMTFD